MDTVITASVPPRIERVAATSSLGPCIAAASPRGVCWLALGDDADSLLAALLRRFPDAVGVRVAADGLLARALAAVEHPAAACDLPLDLRGTPFQLEVWAELRRIPAGSVITYAELAWRIGRPRAYRAVAQACGANPVGVLVPCHRVISSDGGLGGFGFGLSRKVALLEREGVLL
jgi:AraC family transcriptional regulator of adaptative response/methylated-DNA-[protein]-cysteine methyltransferase